MLDSGAKVIAPERVPPISLWVRDGGVQRELLPVPALNAGFTETREVLFLTELDREYTLLIDDAPLTTVVEKNVSGWVWKPGFYAGEVRAELLTSDGALIQSWRLDVSPDGNKVGRDLFGEMLADLRDYDPALIVGQEPARQRLGTLGDSQDPLVALARLRARKTGVLRALRAILQEPHSALRARRNLVPLHLIRRVDRQTAHSALRQPTLLAAIGKFDEFEVAGPARELLADVPDVERHYDSPANRCALAMLQALLRRCIDVHERLELKVRNETRSETVTDLRQRWPAWSRFLNETRHALFAASRRQPFSEVSRAEVTAAGLNAVSAHPLYARFYRLSWESLRIGIDGIEDEELLPLSPTWEIYERWCFVELSRRIREMFPSYGWNRRAGNPLCQDRCRLF